MLERRRFLCDLGRFQLELLRIFLSFYLDKAVDRVFDRLGQIRQRFDLPAVYFVNSEISKIIVADRARSPVKPGSE